MPEITTQAGSVFYRNPRAIVYTADALREADFVEVPYLYCTQLTRIAAPEVDTARLEYEYGTILRPGASSLQPYEKLDLVGKFVKVEIVDTVLDESDEPVASIVWYGVIEGDSKEVMGSRGDVPAGFQTFTAFGLLRIAERVVIRESVIEDPADSASTIQVRTALPFNQDTGGIFVRRGNRSSSEIGGSYVFSPQTRSLTTWNAYEACRYLFKRFAPKDTDDNVANEWQFHSTVLASWLDWYDVAVECDGRTLKDILDELINRKRGVGYYVGFDPDTDKIEVHVFSFVDGDVTLPNGDTLTANPDQYTLDFEASLDVDAVVNSVGTTQYHKVLARGAKRTSTFTGKLTGVGNGPPTDKVIWDRDWNDTELNEYIQAASLEPGYDSLPADRQERWNAIRRASDRLRNVFARWLMNPEWDGIAPDIRGENNVDWLVVPEIPTDPAVDPDQYAGGGGGVQGQEFWRPGCRVLRGLPFLDRYDYSGTKIDEVSYGASFSDIEQPDYIAPFAFLESQVPGGEVTEKEYERLDTINITSLTSEDPRRWAAGFVIPDTECAVELRVHPQQMMGLSEWEAAGTGVAATAPDHDPIEAAGCDWKDVRCTVCIEIDEHVQQEEGVGELPPTDAPVNTLVIDVPDARFDYVVPYTVVECKDGKAVQTTSGGAIRDDRKRLASIALAAAQWYGRKRQTLDLSYKTARGLFELGWLITSVGTNYSETDVNTVVTSITYNLNQRVMAGGGAPPPMTIVRTSYAELDLR